MTPVSPIGLSAGNIFRHVHNITGHLPATAPAANARPPAGPDTGIRLVPEAHEHLLQNLCSLLGTGKMAADFPIRHTHYGKTEKFFHFITFGVAYSDTKAAFKAEKQTERDLAEAVSAIQFTLSCLPADREAQFAVCVGDVTVRICQDVSGRLSAGIERSEDFDEQTTEIFDLPETARSLSQKMTEDILRHPELYPKDMLKRSVQNDMHALRSPLRRSVYTAVLRDRCGVTADDVGNIGNTALRSAALQVLQGHLPPNRAAVTDYLKRAFDRTERFQSLCNVNDEQAAELMQHLEDALIADAARVDRAVDIAQLTEPPRDATPDEIRATRVHDLLADLVLNRDAGLCDATQDRPGVRLRETLTRQPDAVLTLLRGGPELLDSLVPDQWGDGRVRTYTESALGALRTRWEAFCADHPLPADAPQNPEARDRLQLTAFLREIPDEALADFDSRLCDAVDLLGIQMGQIVRTKMAELRADFAAPPRSTADTFRAAEQRFGAAVAAARAENRPIPDRRAFSRILLQETARGNIDLLAELIHRGGGGASLPPEPLLSLYQTLTRFGGVAAPLLPEPTDSSGQPFKKDGSGAFVLSREYMRAHTEQLIAALTDETLNAAVLHYADPPRAEDAPPPTAEEKTRARRRASIDSIRRALPQLTDAVRADYADFEQLRNLRAAAVLLGSTGTAAERLALIGARQTVLRPGSRPGAVTPYAILRTYRPETDTDALLDSSPLPDPADLRAAAEILANGSDVELRRFAEGESPVAILKSARPSREAAAVLKRPCDYEPAEGRTLRNRDRVSLAADIFRAGRERDLPLQDMMKAAFDPNTGYGRLLVEAMEHYFDAEFPASADVGALGEEIRRAADDAAGSNPAELADRAADALDGTLGTVVPESLRTDVRTAAAELMPDADTLRAAGARLIEAAATPPDTEGLTQEQLRKRRELSELRAVDRRSMVASFIRYTRFGGEEQPDAGQILGAVFKGAGPIMQKALQGLDCDVFGETFSAALKDMKSSLAPIDSRYVQAQLLDIVDRSEGRIEKITVQRSLGAASVGQAFLCSVKLRGEDTPKECVLKLLRPDVRNKAMREKPLFKAIAKTIPGMKATFDGQLERILAELDLTSEAENAARGKVYEDAEAVNPVLGRRLNSMTVLSAVPPSPGALLLERAEGEDAARLCERAKTRTAGLLADLRSPDFAQRVRTDAGVTALYNRMNEVLQSATMLESAHEGLLTLSERWVTEGIFDAGFYHGDLHAGNIMVGANGAKLTVIDYGNATTLTQKQQENVMIAIAGATFKRADWFIDGYKRLLGDPNSDEETEEQAAFRRKDTVTADADGYLLDAFGNPELEDGHPVRLGSDGHMLIQSDDGTWVRGEKPLGALSRLITRLVSQGGDGDTAYRIAVPLTKLQEAGIACPAPIFNFSACQIRLQNATDGVRNMVTESKNALTDALDALAEANPEAAALPHLAALRATADGIRRGSSFLSTVGSVLLGRRSDFLGGIGFARSLGLMHEVFRA